MEKANFIFNKKKILSFLQVILLATYWIHMWSYLSRWRVFMPWSLGVTIWQWWHEISTAYTVDLLIED
jgi:hypothetical protein